MLRAIFLMEKDTDSEGSSLPHHISGPSEVPLHIEVPGELELLEQKALETTQTAAGRKPEVGTRAWISPCGFLLIT